MTDPAEDIAEALRDFTNKIGDLRLPVMASTPEDPLAEMEREKDKLRVFFVPYAKTAEKTDRGGTIRRTIQISMMVLRKITSEFTRRKLSDFTADLAHHLRGHKQCGYTWGGEETVSQFDATQLHENTFFVAIVRLNYVGMR